MWFSDVFLHILFQFFSDDTKAHKDCPYNFGLPAQGLESKKPLSHKRQLSTPPKLILTVHATLDNMFRGLTIKPKQPLSYKKYSCPYLLNRHIWCRISVNQNGTIFIENNHLKTTILLVICMKHCHPVDKNPYWHNCHADSHFPR